MKLEKKSVFPVGFEKTQFIKLDISNWRIGKIQFR
jgi:hypothetical protein